MNLNAFLIIVVLSVALFLTHGNYHPILIFALPVVLVISLIPNLWPSVSKKWIEGLSLGAIIGFLLLILSSLDPTVLDWPHSVIYPHDLSALDSMMNCYLLSLVLVLVLYGMSRNQCSSDSPQIWISDKLFHILILVTGIALSLVIVASPHPLIDTWGDQEYAMKAIFEWKNPYTLEMDPFYPPELAKIYMREHARFGYLPGILIWFLPWKFMDLDVRFSFVFAHLLCAFLIFKLTLKTGVRSGFMRYVPALMFLFCPISPFIIEQSWNDHFSCLCLVGIIYGIVSQRTRYFFIAMSALLLSKQSYIISAPFLFWLAYRRFNISWKKLLINSCWFPLLVYSVFLTLDAKQFVSSVTGITTAIQNEIRHDSFSLMNWLDLNFGFKTALLIPVVIGGAGIRLCIRNWKTPNLISTVEGLGLLYLSCYMVSPKAHINYYWFTLIFYFILLSIQKDQNFDFIETREPQGSRKA